MKLKSLFSIIALALCVGLFTGCASTETNLYKGVGVVTTTVEAARQAFVDYENTGAVTQKQHDDIAALYAKYQASMTLADKAFELYHASGSGDATAVTAAIAQVAANSAEIVAAVEALLPPPQTAKLKASLPKGK